MNDQLLTMLSLAGSLAALVLLLAVCLTFATLFGPWMRAFTARTPVSVVDLLFMRLRGVPPGLVVDALAALGGRGHAINPRTTILAQQLYLSKRGLIHTPQQLADLAEAQLGDATSSATNRD